MGITVGTSINPSKHIDPEQYEYDNRAEDLDVV
jgi:hypothetical protein